MALSLLAGTAFGQAGAAAAPAAPAEPAPPGAAAPPPTTMETIAKAVDVPYRPKGAGHLVQFNLDDADLAELVNHISGLTGKRFIYGPKLRKVKATVVSPTPVTLNEAYEAFLAILQANGMTVVPYGPFLKVVDTGKIASEGTPIYPRGAPVPSDDTYVTRLYRVRHATAEDASQMLSKFKTKEGDIVVYAPGQLLIITDTGASIQRMIRLLEEVDVGGVGTQMWIEPVHYGAASEFAKKIGDVFDVNAKGGGTTGLTKVIADEQSNSIILVGTQEAYQRVIEFLKRIDTPPSAEGRIHVLPLQHSVADELSGTLSQMLQGATKGAKGGAGAQSGPEGLFEGEVRVTADKSTNSLIITSSSRDYAQLRVVIDDLDRPRRQVFIEAVVMDVDVKRALEFGVHYHGGDTFDTSGGQGLGFGAVNGGSLGPPLPPSTGLMLGVRGPEIKGSSSILGTGFSIPAFGVTLTALATRSDVNVLSTPHIVATDNTPAEIYVGQNIPLQTNIGGMNVQGLPVSGAIPGATGMTTGFSTFGFSAPRQDVGTKVKITPHINESSQVRLEIEEEISDAGAAEGTLGAVPIQKRTATTTLIVGDQETVVIGGLMRDHVSKSEDKVPVLGDIPLIGFLFRNTVTRKAKSNLLLVMTPHIVRNQTDMRRIFERKMQERQEFMDRVLVFGGGDWQPPRDWSRTSGLVEHVRQSYRNVDAQERLDEELRQRELRTHEPSEPIDLPEGAGGGGGSSVTPVLQGTKPVPSAGGAPASAPATLRGKSRSLREGPAINVEPPARSVGAEPAE